MIVVVICMSMLLAQDKGLSHYQNHEYEAAQEYYESVLRERGNQAQAHFGRGSSAFQQGDLETAKHSFEQSLKADDEQLKSKAMYNLGNTFYQNQKTEEALAFYRKALELDPTDKEAKYNYEFLKYQQEPPEDQQEQDQSNKEQENKEQDQEQENEQEKEQEKKDQDQKNKEQEDKNQEQEENEEQQENQEQQQQQEAFEEEKSQDLKQAESILDALKQDEKIMQKRQISRSKSRKLAKDW